MHNHDFCPQRGPGSLLPFQEKRSPWIPVGQEVSSRWEPNLELLEAPWGHPKLGWLGLKGPPLEAPSARGIFYLVDVDLHLRAPTCSEV